MELAAGIVAIKTLIFCSVIFVWVIRYSNIVEEFKQFNYPNWLRDLVGITKLTLVTLMMTSSDSILLGAYGMIILMIAALATHLRLGNPLLKMLPSATLLGLNLILVFSLK